MNKQVPCEVYSRVVGYYRPVNNWNMGKRQEYHERQEFDGTQSLVKADVAVVPLVGGGCETIDSYKLFTFPNCSKCTEVKEYLNEQNIQASIIDLKSPEGNKEFRGHYSEKEIKDMIERDDHGALKLPVLMAMSEGKVVSVAQTLDDTKSLLC